MSIALIVAIIGGVIYLVCSLLAKYPEVGELGRLAFAVGLLAFLLKLSPSGRRRGRTS
jgi:hypothetical protein